MAVEIIHDKSLWDKFIDDSPQGLLFHKWDFLKIAEKHTGYKLLTYGVYMGEELVCVFPLFHKKTMGLKTLFSPPPRSAIPCLGPVMGARYDGLRQRRKESQVNEVVDEVHREMTRLSPAYTSIALAPGFIDVRPFQWNDYHISSHFSYHIDINRPAEEIWDEFGKDCRSGIRKCAKNAVLEQTCDVGAFYDIMKARYNQQGLNLPIASKEYLLELAHSYPDNLKAFFVRNGPDVFDIELACEYKDSFKLWMGGAIIQKSVSGYQEYATWELIKMAREKGYKDFEIMGAGVKRICTFQSKFNPCLAVSFSIGRNGLAGKAAEWGYKNFVKKKWV